MGAWGHAIPESLCFVDSLRSFLVHSQVLIRLWSKEHVTIYTNCMKLSQKLYVATYIQIIPGCVYVGGGGGGGGLQRGSQMKLRVYVIILVDIELKTSTPYYCMFSLYKT